MMQRPPDDLALSPEEGAALITRLEADTLSAADRRLLVQVVRWLFWLLFVVQEAKLSLKRLRRLVFGQASPSLQAEGAASGGAGDAGAHGPGAESAGGRGSQPSAGASRADTVRRHEATGGEGGRRGGHRPGQGRLGAEAYEGAERVTCHHETLRVGDLCPVCGRGRLYTVPPGVAIRLDGNALLSAVRYELEKLRCSACGAIFTAALPPSVGEEKYSARARAVLAVCRYYLGLPLYRLASYQAMLGVPVADATQWDQIEKVGDCGYIVFAYLERLAAQGELIHQDDTTVRILALHHENQSLRAQAEALGFARAAERTGMYTTVLVVQVGEQTICLYYSGRRHAGENLQALLLQRQPERAHPLVMSDALSMNAADETTLMRCHCLAHGRRQFSDLVEVFPAPCQVVLEALKQVFDHEEAARQAGMSPAARLAYHQALSGPIMEGLKRWLDQQLEERLVEPNSSLGKAIVYMQRHWTTLTRFLALPGAPLDNNVAERALKLFIRQRKNSLFYRTEYSAYLASVLTSLIATCLAAGVNALEYLVALQEHRAAVFANPAAWLPWNYAPTGASP